MEAVSEEKPLETSGLTPRYRTYEHQKCFLAYTEQAPWSTDLLSACEETLSQPEFNLELDYASKHFDPSVTLRQKALELIANARYGIYDLSYWQDEDGKWQMPRNVFIELGMAIALNRPTLLVRHPGNGELEIPECLKSLGGRILEFSGQTTLKGALETRLPHWLDERPERDWWQRYCIFGERRCRYREVHPRASQWGEQPLHCHISDSRDIDREDFRAVVERVLECFRDVTFNYLDSLPVTKGYEFLLCTCCQTVRSTPFAIYRVTPNTPPEALITIGMSIALEMQFDYRIPKILLTKDTRYIPSLLSGYEVIVARNDQETKARLHTFVPTVIRKARATAWKPRPLPFIEPMLPLTEETVEEIVGDLTWDGCLRLAAEHTMSELAIQAHTYQARTYVARKPAENWILDRIQDSSHALSLWVIGAAGSGKTSLLCHLAEQLVEEENTAVFLYSAGRLLGQSAGALLSTTMGQSGDLASDLELLNAQLQERDRPWHLVLIIDGLDEHPRHQAMQEIDRLSAFASSYPWFKILVSSRLEYFEESGVDADTVDVYILGGFNESELPDVYRIFQVEYKLKTAPEELSERVRELIRDPLMLRRLAEAYRGRAIPADPGALTSALGDEAGGLKPAGVTDACPHALIVDDDPGARQRLIDLCQAIGCETAEAETNNQALDLLNTPSASFSLVCTDALRRPERAGEVGYMGLELVREINQAFPELPVVLVSRDDPAFLKNRAPDLRVRGVVEKGLSDQEIVTAIREVLAGGTLPNPWQVQSTDAQEKSPRPNDPHYSLWRLVADLESELRELVDRAMQSGYGAEWQQQLDVGQEPARLTLSELLKLVDNEGEIFQPLFKTPEAYSTLVTAAREITQTRNAIAHDVSRVDGAEIGRVQELVEELLPAVRDAERMVENAENVTTEPRLASRDDETGLSPEELLVLTIFGEARRSGKTSVDARTHRELAERIQQAFEELTPREARILRLRFGLAREPRHTLEEVGKKFGVTGERIRQIEAGALAKLRRPATGTRLREYVDYLTPESESSEQEPLAFGASRTFVATLGLVIDEVLASEELPPDVPTEYPHLCDWLEADLRERLHEIIGAVQTTEPSKRDGEILSVRIAFEWQQDRQPDFEAVSWWSVLELIPFEEAYPEKDAARFWERMRQA